MNEETNEINSIAVPSRERIIAAEEVMKELWDCAAKLGPNPHIMLSISYTGDVDWTIWGTYYENGLDSGDPIELLRKAYPSEEEKRRVDHKRKKEELLKCENRANELRKELNDDLQGTE